VYRVAYKKVIITFMNNYNICFRCYSQFTYCKWRRSYEDGGEDCRHGLLQDGSLGVFWWRSRPYRSETRRHPRRSLACHRRERRPPRLSRCARRRRWTSGTSPMTVISSCREWCSVLPPLSRK